jgi:hypothetical protein
MLLAHNREIGSIRNPLHLHPNRTNMMAVTIYHLHRIEDVYKSYN